jgi:type IX secretion system PorP/SprF family membrane protein
MFNPIFINPAYAGYKEQPYFQSYYRKQWAGLYGSPETFAFGMDVFLPEQKLGVGLVGLVDKLGAQKNTSLLGNISYRLRFENDRYLNLGLALGLINRMVDGTKLFPGDMDDPVLVEMKNNVIFPEGRVGAFYFDDYFFVGFSVDNLIPKGKVLDRELIAAPSTHINLSAGTWMDINADVALKPSMLFVDDFKAPSRLDVNASFVFLEKFWVGASYRTAIDYAKRSSSQSIKNSSSIVGLFEIFVKGGLRIGYAYDHNLTGLDIRSFSTHEISVGYLLPEKRIRTISPRYF